MLRTSLISALTIGLSWLALPPIASAQLNMGMLGAPSQQGIAGSGTATVRERPTLVRMVIQLSEKAETLEEALTRIKDRQEAAILQLEALGVDSKSVEVQPPTLAAERTEQQRRMEQMMRMRQMQGRRVPKGLQAPKIVTVTATLTAEWPLDMSTQEEILTFVAGLEKKITDADLAGTKDQKELSPEAEEMSEEMEMMMMDMGYDESQAQPGEPRFYYVATLTDAAREKAMAEAFLQAQTQATQLATAAGIKLGALQSLSGYAGQSSRDTEPYYYSGASQAWLMLAQQAYLTGRKDPGMVAVLPTASPAAFQITVNALFGIQE